MRFPEEKFFREKSSRSCAWKNKNNVIMDIRIRKKKDIDEIEAIKEIEGIKCNSKLISRLLKAYREQIRLQNALAKTKPV